jgi:L-asparaginase II
MNNSNPVLVNVLRGGAVESIHRGAWAVVDAEGALHSSAVTSNAPSSRALP